LINRETLEAIAAQAAMQIAEKLGDSGAVVILVSSEEWKSADVVRAEIGSARCGEFISQVRLLRFGAALADQALLGGLESRTIL
jgi:hypothetical protein